MMANWRYVSKSLAVAVLLTNESGGGEGFPRFSILLWESKKRSPIGLR
jgi:hypothetical protein